MAENDLLTIANALVNHCRAGTEREGLATLYADDAVSVEPAEMQEGAGRETRGLNAIQAKHDWWDSATEVHSFEASDPLLHGDDRFAVIFKADFTMKDGAHRMKTEEVAVYHVTDGKIVREEFFFTM